MDRLSQMIKLCWEMFNKSGRRVEALLCLPNEKIPGEDLAPLRKFRALDWFGFSRKVNCKRGASIPGRAANVTAPGGSRSG